MAKTPGGLAPGNPPERINRSDKRPGAGTSTENVPNDEAPRVQSRGRAKIASLPQASP
jgi:hypothetical protein